MVAEFRLPDLGEGIREAEVLAVKVRPGQDIKEDEPLFEVETDKAVVEIPSPFSGKVEKVLVNAGDIITVGSIMVTFAIDGKIKQPSTDKQEATLTNKVASPATAFAPQKQLDNLGAAGPVPATPATRRLARELGVDLHAVRASGDGGRVLKEDVRALAASALEPMVSDALALGTRKGSPAAAGNGQSLTDKYGGVEANAAPNESLPSNRIGGTPEPLPDFTKYGTIERVQLRSVRRKTAEGMARSWAHIPHVMHGDEADLTRLEEARQKLEPDVKKIGARLTLTPFVLKAVASALKKYPQFNSSLDESTSEIVFKHYYNLGVAVATDRGLIVPVIRNVDTKGIIELSFELNEIAEKARAGKIELERLQGGSFTVTNIGAIGGTSMTPLINYPEAAILGMGRAKEKPVVHDGQIGIGLIMPFALSFDHRIADGAEAAYFLRDVISRLEEPYTFILEA